MIKRLLLFFIGWVQVYVSPDAILKCTEILRIEEIECSRIITEKSGSLRLVMSLRQFSKFKKAAVAEALEYSHSNVLGLPQIFLFFLRRPGIALGVILFTVLTVWSGRIIWNIDIIGNDKVSDESIISLLAELGCSYGDDYTKIDFDRLHSDFLVMSDDISWISVNMKGTHARVEVRELRRGGDEEIPDTVGANVIAAEDAQIMLLKVESGLGAVNNGDVVKKGDLLISGVIPLREGGVRFEYADGEVLSYVSRTVEVEIPFKSTEKTYTGRKSEKNFIKIFKKSINLSLNYGIEYTTYDKIVESERLYLFGLIPLPVWVDKVTFKEYENSETVLESDAAVSAALKELRFEIDEILKTCEIVGIKQICSLSDESYIIKQEMLCITDVAETREFTADVSQLTDVP